MEFKSHQPIYLQIYFHICEMILNDKFKVGEKIMSVREMAIEVGVNPNTVMRSYELLQNKNIIINQTIQVPIGCGFGTSAASAIGTSICINEHFNLGLSIEECGKYAHLAEVELGTGLGDVIGELSKGIVLRTKPGAPGYGEAKSIVPHEKTGFGVFESLKSDFYVITKSLGEISTASIIQDPKHKKIITQAGLEIGEEFNKKDDGIVIGSKFKNKFNVAVDSEFNEEETIKKFMNASLKFAKKTHLINDELLEIVHELHGKVLGSSMAMLGNTVFAIANEDQKLKLEAKYYNEFDFYKMETEGIRIENSDIGVIK